MEPKLTGYISTNLSFIENAAKDLNTFAAVGLGAKYEKNGLYAQAEGGYGNVIYAKVEAGNVFSLDENNRFGIKTAIGGQYAQATKDKDYYKNIFEKGGNSPTWKANDLRGYGETALTYNSTAFKASIGIRGGVKTCTQASLDDKQLSKVGEMQGSEYAGRTTKAFVTPTVNIEAGKKLRFCMSAALDELNIGAKFYF